MATMRHTYKTYRRNGSVVSEGFGTLNECQQYAEFELQNSLSIWTYKIFDASGACVFTR
ncbi:MAG: hypothetical protein K2H46_02465 [Muribaculaceae bacterium]|nr:hypothetical protein [Muribaculaceae bacterium]